MSDERRIVFHDLDGFDGDYPNFEPKEHGASDFAIERDGDSLVRFGYACDDTFYSFSVTVPLGKLLAELGFTTEDCRRAAELGEEPEKPK